MDVENNFIKPTLKFHFNKGHSETEAYKEISKQYGPYGITLRTIYKWYTIFKSEVCIPDNHESTNSKLKLSDDYIIDLVNKNPDLNLTELAKLSDTSIGYISKRIKQINCDGKRIIYKSKVTGKPQKFTDEFLIDLVNENPDLSINKLAKLADVSPSAIYRRIAKINKYDKKVKYESKPGGRTKKVADEFLIELINENPELCMDDLATLTESSINTIAARLKKIASDGEKIRHVSKRNQGNKSGTEHNQKPKLTNERLIDLIKENPNLNMSELGNLANVSRQTISYKLKQINFDDEQVKYLGKKAQKDEAKTLGRPKRFTDEYLINLINENPDLCMEKLAKLAHTSVKTISNRIKEINSESVRVNYVSKKTKRGLINHKKL